MKFKYLLNPIRTASSAWDMLADRFEMRKIARQRELRFRGDNRYNPSAVTEGFFSRIDNAHNDTTLLNRICTVYRKTVDRQASAEKIFDATVWWQQVRERSLSPVMSALSNRDLVILGDIYRNFFRDPCSTGLVHVPYGMVTGYFGGTISDSHRRYYLGEVLQRVDDWTIQTSGRFALQELAGPLVGNPFGAMVEGTLIDTGAPHRHYCAQKIRQQLPSAKATVVEIGGGFGGMAYYLLRDSPETKYIDFDVPESIALTSYYLMRAFPHLNVLLYGEKELTRSAIAEADVVLLPLFELSRMPPGSAEITFSSHSMADLSNDALFEYMKHIVHTTKRCFFYVGIEQNKQRMPRSPGEHFANFICSESRTSAWEDKHSAAEVECLYDLEFPESQVPGAFTGQFQMGR